MTSLKKTASVALLISALSLSGTAAMASTNNGFGIGPIAAITPLATDGGVALTYFAPSYLASVTANYVYTKAKDSDTHVIGSTSDNQSMFGLGVAFELRNPLTNTLNFDYGVTTEMVSVSNLPNGLANPYAVGLSVGFDYQIAPNLIGFASTSPLAYIRGVDKSNIYAVLAETSLGASYLF